MAQSNSISIFVKSQVPDFWNRDGEELVGFIQTYYEWLEQFENPIQVSRKLADYKDADLIPDKYFQFMRNEFMKSIPVTLVDDRLLLKNIVDFYRARGTEKAYNMLFRILYGDENVSYYYPGKDMLRASDGKWVIERSLKLSLVVPLDQLEDLVVIRGTSSNATARKDKFISYVVSEVQTNELYINNIFGAFEINEGIINDDTGQQIGFVTSMVTYPGGWIGTDGFLSSNKYLQDNFFYQEYSYQIRSSHALVEYESVATQLVHPAGTKLFGAVDMLARADLSQVTFSLLSNLENVGDVAKITISYELILNETAIHATSNTEPRVWATKTGTQDVETQNTIGFWGNVPAFQMFGNIAFTDFSDAIVFRSDVPSFHLNAWTPIKIIDTTHSANTYHFPQFVVNNTVLILSSKYQYGNTSNLHYQTYLPDVFGTNANITEGNDTLVATGKIALKGAASITESGDTLSAASTLTSFNAPVFVGVSGVAASGSNCTYAGSAINVSTGDVFVIGFIRESSFGSSTSAMTLNGTSLTKATFTGSTPIASFANNAYIEFWLGKPAAGTNVTLQSTDTGASAGIFFVWKLDPSCSTTPKDCVGVNASSASSITISDIDRSVNSTIMAIVVDSTGAVTHTEAWTGSETVTEVADATSPTGNNRYAGAHLLSAASASTDDFTFNLSTSRNVLAAGAISIGP